MNPKSPWEGIHGDNGISGKSLPVWLGHYFTWNFTWEGEGTKLNNHLYGGIEGPIHPNPEGQSSELVKCANK